ncbi:MAG: hypothetical protein M3Z87_00390 [Lactobacillus sp.]|nr:hypothetical protein [Lactobacillus sp.]
MSILSRINTKNNRNAIIDTTAMCELYSETPETNNYLDKAYKTWIETGKNSNYSQLVQVKKQRQWYFSAYALSQFGQFYKQLILHNEDNAPESAYNPIKVDITIHINKFKFDKQNQPVFINNRPFLENEYIVKHFTDVELNKEFSNSTYLLNKLIFFGYKNEEFEAIKDLQKEYDLNCEISNIIEEDFLDQSSLSKSNIATQPSFIEFQNQNSHSIIIPAFSNTMNQSATKSIKKVDNSQNNLDKAKKSIKETVDKKTSTTSNNLKVEEASPSIQQAKSKDISPVSNNPSEYLEKQIHEMLQSKEIKALMSEILPKWKNFDYNPIATESTILEEAVQSTDFDNQIYFLEKSNDFKEAANHLISNKENELRLAIAKNIENILIDSIKNKIQQTQNIEEQFKNDEELIKRSKAYYKKHLDKAKQNLAKSQKIEIQKVQERLTKEYESKLKTHIAEINSKFQNQEIILEEKINAQTELILNDSRDKRNAELNNTLKNINKKIDLELPVVIRNNLIDCSHVFITEGDNLYKQLYGMLEKNQNNWRTETSNLVKKQTEFNKSQKDLILAKQITPKNTKEEISKSEHIIQQQTKTIDELTKQQQTNQEKIVQLNNDRMHILNQYSTAQNQKMSIEKELNTIKSNWEQEKIKVTNKDKTIKELNTKLSSFQQLQQEKNEMSQNNKELEDAKTQHIKELSEKDKIIKELNTKISSLQKIQEEKNQIAQNNKELKDTGIKHIDELNQKDKVIKDLNFKINSLQKEQQEKDQITQNNKELKEVNEKNIQELKDKEHIIQKLNKQLEEIQHNSTALSQNDANSTNSSQVSTSADKVHLTPLNIQEQQLLSATDKIIKMRNQDLQKQKEHEQQLIKISEEEKNNQTSKKVRLPWLK